MRNNFHALVFVLVQFVGFLPMAAHAQKYRGIENWRYIPVDTAFWKDFAAALDRDDFNDASKMALHQEERPEGPEKNEAKLAEILLLEKVGQRVQAFHRSVDLVEFSAGSAQGLMALSVVERLARESSFDLREIQRIVNVGSFSEVPEKVLSFVAYLVTIDNLGRGYTEWAARSEAFLKEESHWGLLYQIQQILSQITMAPDEVGLNRLQAMRDKVAMDPPLKKIVDVQIARVMHRLKMYQAADRAYGAIQLGSRDDGRLLYERSWVRYGLLDYSVSLGLLESLKAPFFSVAIDPEQYILSMIEYRDLCHYPAVRKLTKEFNDIFSPTLKVIRAGEPLEKNPVLIRMVAEKAPYQAIADEIGMLKGERRDLVRNSRGMSTDFVNVAALKSEFFEKILTSRFIRAAEKELKSEAERLVALNEQVKLIEYVSDLDEYRLNQMYERRAYESKKGETHATEGLFWPFVGEYWRDELSNYRVLISDRCHTGQKEIR